jgi:hypothetical protein
MAFLNLSAQPIASRHSGTGRVGRAPAQRWLLAAGESTFLILVFLLLSGLGLYMRARLGFAQ